MYSILIGLILLMILAYRGWSIVWLAPLIAGVVALLSGMDLLETYTQPYMQGFVDFTKAWFPAFLLGAIFGKLMEDTGAAKSVAVWATQLVGKHRAILGVLLGASLLTYGGVSLFVVVFAIYPIALALFRDANISRVLIPTTIALGAFTFTMTSLPGTPQIQNLIPMKYFGTTPIAGPIMGITASLIMAVGGYLYLVWREKRLSAQGIVFDEPSDQSMTSEKPEQEMPSPIISFIPLIAIVLSLNILKLHIVPAMLIGIALLMISNIKKWSVFLKSINLGAQGSVTAIINTSAAVGFGAVVKAAPGFQKLTDILLNIKGSPLISEALSVQLMAGITGSASGGMGIALEALGHKYYELSQSSGIAAEAFHRIASIASGSLILPNNGALLTLLAVTAITHKQCYRDVFVIAVLLPTLAYIIAIILASIGLY